MQLTLADFLVEIHDTHHPIGSGLYYEEQKAEASRRAEDFRASRAPKYFRYFERLLDASAVIFAPERVAELGLPDDELHNEILLPLLPAMIADKAIREHWKTRTAGFVSRLKGLPEPSVALPRWNAADFEIHVTASYQAGVDARALADTLLSEESLREMVAAIMNTATQKVWSRTDEPVSALVSETITMVCGIPHGRRVRRSTVRTPDAGTFIVRRLLAGHWTAQKNRAF